MNDGDSVRMGWDTDQRIDQSTGGVTWTDVLRRVLIGFAITVALLPVFGVGLLLLACVTADF